MEALEELRKIEANYRLYRGNSNLQLIADKTRAKFAKRYGMDSWSDCCKMVAPSPDVASRR
jgi:hypothetical protein